MRWYLRFRLPYADLAELLAERGVHVDPSTIFDWVQRFTPVLACILDSSTGMASAVAIEEEGR